MSERPARARRRIADRSPETVTIAGFGGLIAVGAVLLSLPVSHHGSVRAVDALFTATSAVCVTGLAVVDIGSAYTAFGCAVILVLIQFGGIGVMSVAAFALLLFGRRLSLNAQAALGSSMLQRDLGGELKSVFWRILRFVIIAEGLGASLLFLGMLPSRGAAHAARSAVFHAVSAFCNAGFSIYADNLTAWRSSPVVMSTVMALIVLGGIGHSVVVDLTRALGLLLRGRKSGRIRLELGSVVALATSGALIAIGVALLLLFGLTPEEARWTTRLSCALFQSVTARTAGFNTVNIGALPPASLLSIVLLMFVGGSPGSCAGGIKTTTLALWLSRLWNLLRGEKWPRLCGRHIPPETTRRASMIIGLAVLWNLAGLLLLLSSERGTPGVGLQEVLFEQISAFGTVGLSTGLTPHLSVVGKLWIVTTMFVGRLGPLTLAFWAFTRTARGIRYPEGRIMIG